MLGLECPSRVKEKAALQMTEDPKSSENSDQILSPGRRKIWHCRFFLQPRGTPNGSRHNQAELNPYSIPIFHNQTLLILILAHTNA